MPSEVDRDKPVQITVADSRRGGPLRLAFGAIALALVGLLVLLGVGRLLDWNPFGDRQEDRSGPTVLTAVRDLHDYHAASGQYQVVIDLKEDNRLLPDIFKGKRTIFLAIGSVDAVVDFSKLGDDAITVSEDRRTVALTLPHATLAKPVVDPDQSRILDRDLGVLDRLGNVFKDKPDGQEQAVYGVAEQRLADAAGQNKLVDRAETNTKVTLDKLLKGLGFTTVTIRFVDSPNGS
jgi:hypothetical protein